MFKTLSFIVLCIVVSCVVCLAFALDPSLMEIEE